MSLDLKKLENKLCEALSNETNETLTKFLTNKRMSNYKQSSGIDFYRSRIIKITADGLNKRITGEQWDLSERKAYEQAKAMHKEEHGQTWDKSLDNLKARGMNEMRAYTDFDNYYNETYGGGDE